MPLSSDFIFAKGTTQSEWDFLAIPGNVPTTTPTWGYTTKTESFDPRFKIGGALHGWFYGVQGTGGHALDEGRKVGPDVNGYSDFAGVFGTGVFVTGVAGTSIFGPAGVYGQMGEDLNASISKKLLGAVIGASNEWPAVVGWSTQAHGVLASSQDSVGVQGSSFNGIGVFGSCQSGAQSGVVGRCTIPPMQGPTPFGPLPTAGVTGTSGGPGPSVLPGFSTIPGVFGTSNGNAGVVGTSDQLMGVYGFSTGNAGVVGQSGNPNSFGGFFFGNVMITGNLTVNGQLQTPNKQAVVAFPDGTQRVLYCMESPEYWFEDFGAAKLKRGRVVVRLGDFGNVIRRGAYHVFLTPRGDCRGLYVHRQAGASFEVRELAGGKSSVAFSYRIVGRRKDIRAPRFAKTNIRRSLSLPTSAPMGRPGKRSAAELRAFVAGLEKEMRRRAPKIRKRPPLPRGLTRPPIRPDILLPTTEQT